MKNELYTIDGQRWRRTHQATVDAVLLPIGERRPVKSEGAAFFNVDNWPARRYASAMCEWARLNRGSVPTRTDIEGWVIFANQIEVHEHQKRIQIATTPDELSRGLAYALVGGGYHEAWHTLYSRRKPLHVNEVVETTLKLWHRIPYDPSNRKYGWAPMTNALLQVSNLVEDIRIERLGCVAFPGAPEKMEALQDLILDQETEGKVASEHRARSATNEKLTIILGAFRDLGLGYDTPTQKLALKGYQENAVAYAFVESGPLRPLLDRAIAMKATDGLGSLFMAMEFMAIILETMDPPPEEEQKAEEKKEKGKGQKGAPNDAQPEASDAGEGEGEGEGTPSTSKKPVLFKKGDRATLKAGPFAGKTVEITVAGLPDQNGVQKLDYRIVEA